MRRKSIPVAAVCGAVLAPLAAWADSSGSVTTSPVQQAPALAMPALLVLAVALTTITMYRLRGVARGPISRLGCVAALTILAGLAYAAAPPIITVNGADCAKQTVSVFDPLTEPTLLTSNCPNPIQIIAIQITCDEEVVSPTAEPGLGGAANDVVDCTVGQILANGNICGLPVCVC